MTNSLYLQNHTVSDIHDQAASLIHPTCRLLPMSAPNELLKLSALVRPRLDRIKQPVLVMHSISDHTCPAQKNLDYVMGHLGSTQKRAVMLEQSYHVITVDLTRNAWQPRCSASRINSAPRRPHRPRLKIVSVDIRWTDLYFLLLLQTTNRI